MKLQSLALVGLMVVGGCASSPSSAPNKPPIAAAVATQSLNDPDKAFVAEKFNQAMETSLSGQTTNWTTPSGDYQVQLTPGRAYQKADETEAYCREFTQAIGETKEPPAMSHGTACRQSDGTWQIVG
jgi:surface antigen